MKANDETPLRHAGIRTPEGWVLVRDARSTYHDGVEEALYDVFHQEEDRRSTSPALFHRVEGRAAQFQVDPSRANIVRALDLAPDARVLEIGAGTGAVTRLLGERAGLVDAVEPSVARARAARARTRDLPGVEVFVGEHTDVPPVPTYDVVVVVGVLEYVGSGSADPAPYVSFLAHLARCLRPGGTIAVAIENKLGVKYLAGAPEDHTDVAFDGIEGYPAGASVRTFGRDELEALFRAADLEPTTLVAFPDYKLTRTVMHPERLAASAPRLLRSLPAFPSPDLRSPRANLADERLLWGSFVEAGLAGEVGNSFLVLAGAGGPQTLWPDDLHAVYYSRARREEYGFEKRVVETGDGLVVERRPASDAAATGDITVVSATEPVLDAPTVQEVSVTLPVARVHELLGRWKDLLERSATDLDAVPFDLVPNNLVLREDGELVPIDQEWTAVGWSLDRVLRRGVLWFVAVLVRQTPASTWAGFDTVRDVARGFGPVVGLDGDGSWLQAALDEEAAFLTEIGQGPRTDEAVADVRARLVSMLDDRLQEVGIGERLPETFRRLQGYLDGAEQSNRHLTSRVDELARAYDTAREQAESAARAASEATTQAAAARAGESFWRERDSAAQQRYDAQSAEVARVSGELATLRASRAVRLISLYRRVVDRVLPAGTRRRAAYSGLLRSLVAVARRLTGRRVVVPVAAPVVLPASAQPLVSVVVPIHGKWEFTERCLTSLAATVTNVPFEVVVVDDASPDDSRARLAAVSGVRVVALDTNVGYVGACNAGIAAAGGELVVLLNNDTRVDPRWLDPLVEAMADETIGLVGSRLVYPDGRLQEAGGLIFSDASGWNYGRLADPEDGKYTYRRDVDYCSGASIMLRRSFLESVGGLDEDLSLAYYDDADLAFAVRAAGQRVVYEPRSVVVHYEGVSHGTDESSGIKAYQAVNRLKFQQKWADALTRQLDPGVQNVQRAARRHQGRGIVVVIDHYVPRPDEDSGSVRMFALLKALRTLGYAVLFVPDNRHRSEPYTGHLQALGVEVFYGHGNLGTALLEVADDVVAVVASRVTVAWNYLVQVRSVLPHVPFVFDTVDLHFLREEREAALRGDAVPARSVAVRELELALVRSADRTVVVSTFEQDLLRQIVPGADVEVLSNVHSSLAVEASPDGREGILFVGSFAHQPNADGLRWFTAEVLADVVAAHPGVQVHVVGRDPAPDLVAAAPPGVTYHGWVDDLAPLYAQARVVIAPLRYGAGVKGKIGEAMTFGVPVVMTPVGAEGMGIRDGETALVAQDAASFATSVNRLLSDDELWVALSERARRHVEERFGEARFREQLAAVLAPPAAR